MGALRRRSGSARRAARRGGRLDERALLVGRGLRRGRDLDQVAVMVVDPDAVELDARRRIDALDADVCNRSAKRSRSSSNTPNETYWCFLRGPSPIVPQTCGPPFVASVRAEPRSPNRRARIRRKRSWPRPDPARRNGNGRANARRARRACASASRNPDLPSCLSSSWTYVCVSDDELPERSGCTSSVTPASASGKSIFGMLMSSRLLSFPPIPASDAALRFRPRQDEPTLQR